MRICKWRLGWSTSNGNSTDCDVCTHQLLWIDLSILYVLIYIYLIKYQMYTCLHILHMQILLRRVLLFAMAKIANSEQICMYRYRNYCEVIRNYVKFDSFKILINSRNFRIAFSLLSGFAPNFIEVVYACTFTQTATIGII